MKEYILWPQQLDQRMSFQNISFIAFTLSYPEYTLSIDHEIVHCAVVLLNSPCSICNTQGVHHFIPKRAENQNTFDHHSHP